MDGGPSASQGGADPVSEPAAKPSDPEPVPAAAATADNPVGGGHDAGAGAAEAGEEPAPKRPRSWQELSQSLIEGMTGAMRAAREGVASMIMAMAEADPFSEVGERDKVDEGASFSSRLLLSMAHARVACVKIGRDG